MVNRRVKVREDRFDWGRLKSKYSFLELNLDRWRDYKEERRTKAKENLNPHSFEEIYENSASLLPLRHNSLKCTL